MHHPAVDGLFVVGVDHADLGLGVVACLESATVELFEAATTDDLNGDHFAGVITLD
ncbi:hypothetical protein D3C71_1978030 [compost metagenome]